MRSSALLAPAAAEEAAAPSAKAGAPVLCFFAAGIGMPCWGAAEAPEALAGCMTRGLQAEFRRRTAMETAH